MNPRYCLLPSYGCIEVSGADTAAFLQGQLSRTVDTLDGSHAPLASWNDARGRVRALFRVVRVADRWLLCAPRDTIAAVVAKLRMFVLRSKVVLATDGDWRAAMLVYADSGWLATHGWSGATAAEDVVRRGELLWVRLSTTTWLALGPGAAIDAFEPSVERAAPELAEVAAIRLGIPEIGAALADRYVPQMLNLERLDAISFDKGCYPGQEVIARVQHRGSVKRRMRHYVAALDQTPAVGAEVRTDTGAVAGEVIRAAQTTGVIELLAVVDHDARAGGLLLDGAELREQPLPYPVPNE